MRTVKSDERSCPLFSRNLQRAAQKTEQPFSCNTLKLQNKIAAPWPKSHEQKSGVVVTSATH